ncbi:hypothetical protein HNR65_000740 [Desulfosalsimonas propionicica]|uniref:Uncharacterized protein n=1 Tax=Desulfosalsimonas propionicica TaxID=332175 RepID=A0A7W0C786_9BACT|nr:hypothetical protein [Desulfosalsimonas propionicica]
MNSNFFEVFQTVPMKFLFFRYTEIVLRYPDGDAEKRVSERKLSLREAHEARKLPFRAADQPSCLWISFLQKYCCSGINSFL